MIWHEVHTGDVPYSILGATPMKLMQHALVDMHLVHFHVVWHLQSVLSDGKLTLALVTYHTISCRCSVQSLWLVCTVGGPSTLGTLLLEMTFFPTQYKLLSNKFKLFCVEVTPMDDL